MFAALLLICLVSPINDYIGDNCIPGAAVVKFELESQCDFYLKQEYDYLKTKEAQDAIKLQLPLYNENRWKVRAVCTKIVIDDYLPEVAL